jgi:hypothetical protein
MSSQVLLEAIGCLLIHLLQAPDVHVVLQIRQLHFGGDGVGLYVLDVVFIWHGFVVGEESQTIENRKGEPFRFQLLKGHAGVLNHIMEETHDHGVRRTAAAHHADGMEDVGTSGFVFLSGMGGNGNLEGSFKCRHVDKFTRFDALSISGPDFGPPKRARTLADPADALVKAEGLPFGVDFLKNDRFCAISAQKGVLKGW